MEDERLAQIEKAKLDAINQSNNTYNQMHQDNQSMLDKNMNYAEQFEQTQNEALDKQLDFYKQNIDKQKQDAQKNYETEALRAENDYVSYTNPYGYQAETMASKGQLQSGISQTAQLGGYNAYQNRLATANKAMQDAFTQYDLDMNEAIINNDVQKAQNALAKLEMILGYQDKFYDTKNQITQSQLSNNQALDESYHGRYMDMINQINTEKQREEAIRQFEAQMAYQKERDKVADSQWEKQYALAKKETNYKTSGGGGGVVPVIGDEATLPEDYYFDNGYQPRYIGGTDASNKVSNLKTSDGSKMKVGDVFKYATNDAGKSMSKQNIWVANGKYYIWIGNGKNGGDYMDVTKEVNTALKTGKPVVWDEEKEQYLNYITSTISSTQKNIQNKITNAFTNSKTGGGRF